MASNPVQVNAFILGRYLWTLGSFFVALIITIALLLSLLYIKARLDNHRSSFALPLTHKISFKAYLGEFAGAIVYCAMLSHLPFTNTRNIGWKR